MTASRLALAAGLAVAVLPSAGCPGRAPAPRSVAIAVPHEIARLDPHAEDRIGSFSVLSNLYEPLVTLDAEMKVRPCLARSWESPSPLTWVFHLVPAAAFHSGRLLRAADVVYSLERVLQDPGLGARNYLRDVAGVRATDALTVEVRTVHPTRTLLNKLSFVPIVPEGAEEARLESAPDGTGPYALARWDPPRTLVLKRHDGYWGPAPALAEVVFTLRCSPAEALEGLQAGRYHLIKCDSRKAAALLERSPGLVVQRRDNLFVKYLAFDLTRARTPACPGRPNPFRDVRVRRALNAAIDRHHLVRELWAYGVPATQMVPRFVFGFDPGIPEPAADLERARSLLREAGVGAGLGVVIHTRTVLEQAATLVAQDLGRVGLAARVEVLPDPGFFDLLGRQGATLWVNRFACLSGDAGELLEDLVHSRGPDARFGLLNYARWANADMDAAIEASAGIEKPEARRDALQALIRRLDELLLVIPLYHDQDVYALDRHYAWAPRADSSIRASEIGLADE